MHVHEDNVGTRSHNHCCCGNAVSITYSECVSVALGIQHAKCMRHVVICGLSGWFYHTFLHLSHKRHDFRQKNVCFDSLYSFFFSLKYSVIMKDVLNFVRLYFLNYTWNVNDLHNI